MAIRSTSQRNTPARGFTLVELLVAMGLMVIITTMLATILLNAQQMYDISVARASVTSNARVALDEIAKDLSHIIPTPARISVDDDHPLSLVLRTQDIPPEAEWNLPAERNRYVDSPDVPLPYPDQSAKDIDKAALMSFYATARFYREAVANQPGRMETRPVRIVYYLKARPLDGNGNVLPGAYLIRRVEPFTWNTADPNPANWSIMWEEPVEDDICTFVRGMRVYFLDRDRQLQNQDMRFLEADEGHCKKMSLPALWEDQPGTLMRRAVVFQIDPEWNGANKDLPFTQKDFLPPALMVELFVCDDSGHSFLEERRIFSLPIAPIRVPKKPGQE